MKFQSDIFMCRKNIPIEAVSEGVTRQIMGFNDEIMVVRVQFEEGSEGYVHSHVHSQVAYVESGEFEVNVGGVIQVLEGGDAFYIPPNVSHGAVCKKAGVLIDTFSPVREDFLEQGEA